MKTAGRRDGLDFEKLYNTYYMQVFSFMMTLSAHHDTVEEITQKTFFKAFTTAQKHNGQSSELTWLCAITKNLFIDETRARKRFSDEADVAAQSRVDDRRSISLGLLSDNKRTFK